MLNTGTSLPIVARVFLLFFFCADGRSSADTASL